jgi:hypothetical protein
MDYRSLEEKSALAISQHVPDTSIEDILSQVETSVRSSESLLEAIDKFYKWLHTRSR